MEKTNKITKEEFDLFCSENLTVKEQKVLTQRINDRFFYIVKSMTTKFKWVDYDNEGGDVDYPGHFSIKYYKENIGFTGEFTIPEPYNSNYEFPTRWLWEDFEEEFKRTVEEYKKAEKEREEKARQAHIDVKANKVANFLKKHNMTVQKIYDGAGQPSNVAIVFNNTKLTEDYVMKFLEKILK